MSRHLPSLFQAALGVACGAGLAWGLQEDGPLSKTPRGKTAGPLELTQNTAKRPSGAAQGPDQPETMPESAALPALTLDEVLAAEGGERLEKLARWLPGATSEEAAIMFERVTEEEETQASAFHLDLILQHWIGIDRKAAFRAGRQSNIGEWSCYEAWGRLDPRAAWKDVQSMNDFSKNRVLVGMAESDPAYARELLGTYRMESHLSLFMHVDIAEAMARTNPAEAADYMLSQNSSPTGALAAWFKNRPGEARAWAESQPTAQKRTMALTRLVGEWAAPHPEKILPLLESLPDGPSKWTVQGRYARSLAQSDPDAAMGYISLAASPLARASMLQDAALASAEGKPDAALKFLQAMDWPLSGNAWRNPSVMTNGEPEKTVVPSRVTEAFSQLSATHPEETLAVAQSVPTGPQRDQILSAVATYWRPEKVGELSAWMDRETSPAVREAGARKVVDYLLWDPEPDYEAAARWAAILPASNSPLTDILKIWRGKDPAAFATALETMEIPSEVRVALEKPEPP